MSHNIHFVVVHAESPKDACINAEDAILDWGTDNNWRTIIGCVSEDDEVYMHDTSSHYDLKHYDTIEKINTLIKNYINFNPTDLLLETKKTIEQFLHGKTKPEYIKWYLAREAMNQMYHKSPFLDKEFNVLEDEVFPWVLDELGVTNHLNWDSEDKLYVVVVDMHS